MNAESGQIHDAYIKPRTTINCRGHLIDLSVPKVMGIINLTPDSFYKGSRYNNHTTVLKRVDEIIEQGGSMVDLGAYSSRPGAEHISEEEEINRLMPFLENIRKHFPDIIISVDTFRSQVAYKAVKEFEADMVNDISGGEMDKSMIKTIAKVKVPYILMHIQGTPQTMHQSAIYKDLMGDILLKLALKVDELRTVGINDIIVDPGFGFGKSMEQNYQLLQNLNQFALFELPVLVGLSRKSMIYRMLDGTPETSLNGTSVLNTLALIKGARILRVHDVKEAVECIKLVEATQGWNENEC